MTIAEGQSSFWEQAYEVHGPAILAFLKSRSRTSADAEELFQETFLRAIKSNQALRDRGKVRSFLFTTAANLLRNQIRRRKVSPFQVDPPPIDRLAAVSATDARVELGDVVEQLDKVLADMPEGHSRAFVLGVIERLPYKEIAGLTGWSLATVKINVYRARKRVSTELAHVLPE